MKFRERKKKKMKKIRQRRIRKNYGYVIGMTIPCYSCLNNPDITYGFVEIIDQTSINGDLYFLVVSKKNKVFIYKVVDISKYSRVSIKKLIKYKKHFENPGQWKEKSDVYIGNNGNLKVL